MKLHNWLLSLTLLLASLTLHAQYTYAYYCPPCNADCDKLMFEEAGDCPHCGMELLRQTPEEHENMLRMTDMTIGFYLQDGVEVLDFAGPMEVFAYAGFKIVTIGKTKDPIRSQGIVKITPDFSIQDAPPNW